MAVVEIVVGSGAIITASAAVGSYRKLSALVDTVESNEDRSITHREWIAGDSNTRHHNLFERVSQLEDEVEV